MLVIYLVGLFAGGLLLVLSFASGEEDDAVSEDGSADVEAEAEAEGETASDQGSIASMTLAVLPIASLRFWTFFLAFGGLAGILLTWVSALAPAAVAVVAASIGYASGLGVTMIVRLLGRSQVSSTLKRTECIGIGGTVLLPIARGSLGRIRVRLENQLLDFDAETDDEAQLGVSEPVVVYDVRDDGVVLVTSTRKEMNT